MLALRTRMQPKGCQQLMSSLSIRLYAKVSSNRVAGMLARAVPVRDHPAPAHSPTTALGMSQEAQSALEALEIRHATEIQVCSSRAASTLSSTTTVNNNTADRLTIAATPLHPAVGLACAHGVHCESS